MRFLPGLRGAFLGGLICASRLFAADLPANDAPLTPLFDGKTLSGWTQYGGKAPFEVKDGIIVGTYVPEKTNSFLSTEKEYADFVFEVDFKANGVKGVNSGVQFRSHTRPESGGINRVFGYQAEIDPVEPAKTGGIYEEAGRAWLADLRKTDVGEKVKAAFRPSDWNTLRIQAVGDHIQTWVNGVPAADFRDAKQASGFIALQVHAVGSPINESISFRNPRIRVLSAPAAQ